MADRATDHRDRAANVAPSADVPEPALQAGSTYYVVVPESPIRLGPSEDAQATGAGYFREAMVVEEVVDGWARITDYYDGRVEDLPGGRVARWIAVASLGSERPPAPAQRSIKPDPRVEGLPSVGQYGLTQRDVDILHAAARFYLDAGQGTRVAFGDKSSHRAGYYFLNFGGDTNFFFRPRDIPELDRLIDEMKQKP